MSSKSNENSEQQGATVEKPTDTKPVAVKPVKKAETVKPAENKVVAPQKQEWEKIWAEIKDKKMEIFSLPAQPISKYCKPILVNPQKLYLTSTVSAVLPALESTLAPKYNVDRDGSMIVVTRK